MSFGDITSPGGVTRFSVGYGGVSRSLVRAGSVTVDGP